MGLPDRTGESALPEIIHAARAPVLAAMTIGAVAFYGPTLVTMVGPGGSSGTIENGGGGGDWDFTTAEAYATEWGMTTADTINFTASDTSSASLDRFAGGKQQPCGSPPGEVPTIESGTTPTGDDSYVEFSYMGTEDGCSPPHFQYSFPSTGFVIECIQRFRVESARNYSFSTFWYKGFGPRFGGSDSWTGWDFTAPADTITRTPHFFDQGNGSDLDNHITGGLTALGADSLDNVAGTIGTDWFKTGMGYRATGPDVFVIHKGHVVSHTDSSGTSFTPRALSAGTLKFPASTLGGGVLTGAPGDTLRAGDWFQLDRCVIWT